ncbi:hypothetical protein N136_03489, partial [Leifsonia aquatica ATCC 14665]
AQHRLARPRRRRGRRHPRAARPGLAGPASRILNPSEPEHPNWRAP